MQNRHQVLAIALNKLGFNGISESGKTYLTDKTFYLNVDLSGKGGGRAELVDSNTRRIEGITNFDGNKLNAGRDIVIDSVRFIEAVDGATSIQTADFSNTDGKAHASLAHAELRVEQAGKVLIDLPLTDFNKSDGDTVHFRDISTMPILKAEEEFNIYLVLPNGVTVPANKYGRFEFRGIQAKK